MIDLEWMKNNPTHVSDTEVLKLINAIEEGKEIIENLKETTRTYAMQTYSKIAHKNADIADEWISKYFEENLGNNGEPIKNTNPEEDISERMWEESDPFDGREEP
jgi:hypothetical protein